MSRPQAAVEINDQSEKTLSQVRSSSSEESVIPSSQSENDIPNLARQVRQKLDKNNVSKKKENAGGKYFY